MKQYEDEILDSLHSLIDISDHLKVMPANTGEILVALAHKFLMNYIPTKE